MNILAITDVTIAGKYSSNKCVHNKLIVKKKQYRSD